MPSPRLHEALLARRPLPHDALRALAASRAAGGRVTGLRRLGGGQTALMHAFDIVAADGTREGLVLRRHVAAAWGQGPDAVEREAAALAALAQQAYPAPRLVDVDPEGARYGLPSLVLQRLPGRPVLAPRDLRPWVAGLARALAALHRLDLDGWPGRDGDAVEERSVRWATGPGAEGLLAAPAADVDGLLAVLRGVPAPRGPKRPVHDDFHPGNVLWHRGRVTGVVDWTFAGAGNPALDVAYCRLDLTLLGGRRWADAFAAAYRASAGEVGGPGWWWDLLAATRALPDPVDWLPGYHRLGRRDLTHGVLLRRLQAFVSAALAAAERGEP